MLDHLPDRTVFERRLGKYVFALVLTVSRAGLKAGGADALACLRLAVTEAEQVFDLDDLRPIVGS